MKFLQLMPQIGNMPVKIKYSTSKLQKSFAAVIVACIAIIFFAGFDDIQAKARDTRRQSDLKDIARALDLYYDRYGEFPEVVDIDYGEWDTTIEPERDTLEFIPQLLDRQIVNAVPQDPINNKIYYYRYAKFPAGSYGCKRPFIILQAFNFEGIQDGHGVGECTERNFVDEAPNGFTIQKFE